MGFHEVRFPANLSFGSVGGPERRTEIVTLTNGFEERNTPWAHARRRYDAGVGLRSLDDVEALIAFFEARQGQLFGFRWKDWADYKSCPASRTVGAEDQRIGTGDGVSRVFALSKAYLSGEVVYVRPIVKPVAGTLRVPNVMVVNPSFPAKTVPEFIAYAKANPGRINMASAGNGTTPHLTGELFKLMTGVNMLHVPYRGTVPALNDLLAEQVHVMFGPIPASIEFIKTGRLYALAVTAVERWGALPDLPTVAEFLPGFEASTFYGVGAHSNTPVGIVRKLNSEINLALSDPTMKARFLDLGGTVMPGSPADFGRIVAEETEKWAKVVKFAGVRAE
jgi:uncharacterized protein (TIGR02217 family)